MKRYFEYILREITRVCIYIIKRGHKPLEASEHSVFILSLMYVPVPMVHAVRDLGVWNRKAPKEPI